jgi:hypothetical protein
MSHEDAHEQFGGQELCHRHTLSLHTASPAHGQWVDSLFRSR